MKDPQTLENWYQKNLYYTPKLEVVSGQDCVKILKDAEITTLSLKESIQFIKAGTVTFKISYDPTGSLTEECNLYRPEKNNHCDCQR